MIFQRILLSTSLLTAGLLGSSLQIAQATDTETVPSIAPVPLEVPVAVTESIVAPTAEPPAPLVVDTAEAFIDRTDYSLGATAPVSTVDEASESSRSPVEIMPGTQGATVLSHPSEPIDTAPLADAGVVWNQAANDSSTAVAAAPMPGLPYVNPKLFQSLARMGNDNLRFLFPIAIPAPITSLFGWRIHPITGSQRMHTGTDIGAPMGTPVLASLAGRVILADAMGGYGLTVAIEHENGIRQTMYAHLSEIFVKPGDLVQQGAVIGRVGSTGASTGPHLHFELRQMMPDGTWMAMDAGKNLEMAMGDLVKSLQVAGGMGEAKRNPSILNEIVH